MEYFWKKTQLEIKQWAEDLFFDKIINDKDYNFMYEPFSHDVEGKEKLSPLISKSIESKAKKLASTISNDYLKVTFIPYGEFGITPSDFDDMLHYTGFYDVKNPE